MSLTEKEARTKACLKVRLLAPYAADCAPRRVPCIASDCMAWRWHRLSQTPMHLHGMPQPDKEMWVRKGWVETDTHMTPPPPTTGFCGLAGQP
jgi:hypothetical protein